MEEKKRLLGEGQMCSELVAMPTALGGQDTSTAELDI